MVAVRSAHLNTEGKFVPDAWIASLGIASKTSCERLAETWRYCEEKNTRPPGCDVAVVARHRNGGNPLYPEYG
ncbi:hypothetical protein DZJ_19510 [Dickeya ananatis]